MTLGTDLYIIPSCFFWGGGLQEINLAQDSQYEATDEHDHVMVKLILYHT